jgi:exonuclease III
MNHLVAGGDGRGHRLGARPPRLHDHARRRPALENFVPTDAGFPLTKTALPGDPSDDQARYIEAAIAGILVGCIYLPNGNPQPGPKFEYKLAWFKRLSAHARRLLRDDVPGILAGDYNVAPTEIDIYPTTSWDDDALVQPQRCRPFRVSGMCLWITSGERTAAGKAPARPANVEPEA